jgi:cellulose biosynthesis protein BcsQ
MPRPNQADPPTVKSQDPEPNHDVNALFSSFRLDQSSYRTFGRHRNPKPPEQTEISVADPSRPEQVRIGIFSPMGGAGKSTLTATLGSILWQHDKKVLLVDAAPWPTLAFHYGATASHPGMRSFFAPGGKELPVRILARNPNDSEIPEIESYLRTDPADYILFDLSGVSGQELKTYLEECQILLIPLIPNSSAVRYVEAVDALLSTLNNPHTRVLYVINQMDESLLAKAVYTDLSRQLDQLLFQKPIYRQVEIQESLAEGVVLPFFVPKSQAAEVCNEIAQWLETPRPASLSRAQQRWSER